MTRSAIDALRAVEGVTKRGKGVVVVHDLSAGVNGGECAVRAYRLTDGAREAAKGGRWDTAS